MAVGRQAEIRDQLGMGALAMGTRRNVDRVTRARRASELKLAERLAGLGHVTSARNLVKREAADTQPIVIEIDRRRTRRDGQR